MPEQLPDIVTLVVRHRVLSAQLTPYEIWLRRIMDAANQFEGHLGVNVMRSRSPGSTLFTIVLQFSNAQSLQAWLDSPERKKMIDEALPMLADGDQKEITAANEFWFTPIDESTEPPRWKQACLTFLVIFPLSIVVPRVWRPVFANTPWPTGYIATEILITATIVLSVVYFFMPRVTNWFADWLKGDDKEAT